MTRSPATKVRVEDYILIGDTMERICRVCVSTKGRTKGKKVAVTVKRRVEVINLSFVRKLNSRHFFNVK